MKNIIVILLFSLSITAFNQERNLNLTADSDTVFWKNVVYDDIQEFNLPQIDVSAEFVFRHWFYGHLFEVKKTNGIIQASIYFYVSEIWENDYNANRFSKEYVVNGSIAKELYSYIINNKLNDIPSQNFIEKWTSGFDGIEYIYENKNDNNYSFKNYWTPSAFENLREAEDIIEFNREFYIIFKLEHFQKLFDKDIPFLSYTYPGSAVSISKAVTKKELRQYKRKRKTFKY